MATSHGQKRTSASDRKDLSHQETSPLLARSRVLWVDQEKSRGGRRNPSRYGGGPTDSIATAGAGNRPKGSDG